MIEADVAIVGAGSAGVAAAVSAAQGGARVVVLERLGACGGQAVSAYVGTVCGLWTVGSSDAPVWACGGWPRAMGERLMADGTRPLRTRDGLWFLPYTPWAFRRLADRALAEARITPWLHATVHGAHREARGFVLDVLAFDRPMRVRAGAVVDVTGHATVAVPLGGVPLDSDGQQAPALVVHVDGLPDGVPSATWSMALLRACTRGVRDGELPADALAISVVPGSVRGRRAAWKLGLRGTLPDDPAAYAACETRGRDALDAILGVLRREDPLWGDLRVVDTAGQVGFRGGRRVRTRHLCTAADIAVRGPRSDGIAAAAWPVEHWGADARPRMVLPEPGAVWEVPAGALEVDGVPGLYVAGRTLGADDEAHASARVIGTCWQTGWAAGALAAGYAAGAARDAVVTSTRAALALGPGVA